MKNIIILLFMFTLGFNSHAQENKFEYLGKNGPSVSREKLTVAMQTGDINSELWRNLSFSYYEREIIEKQVRAQFPAGNFVYPMPENFVYPDEAYFKAIELAGVEISGMRNGKVYKAESATVVLTAEQKNILNTVDPGTDIGITLRFKHKSKPTDKPITERKLIEGTATIAVVPDKEAEYPGGNSQLTKYLTDNIFNKVAEKNASAKIEKAVVKFTVNEEGRIVNARLLRSSTDAKIDKLILDAANKMPAWKPAQNAKGIKVKQEFSIPFVSGGC
jgi:TonB family protein